jgi:flagellar motor protein MotB
MKPWHFSLACLLLAIGLSSCVYHYKPVARTTTFDETDYEEYAGDGTASISGVLRTKLRLGDPRLTSENVVHLMPATSYITEHIEKEFVDQVTLWPPLDYRAHHYKHIRVTDRGREFIFEKLRPGEYYIGCFLEKVEPPVELRSEVYGMLGGRWIFSPITVAEGENLQIVLNEECATEIQVAQAPPEPEAAPAEPALAEPAPPEPAVTLAARALFDSGQAEVKAEGRERLKQLAETLKTVSGKEIRIEGHTDNVPIRGRLRNKFPTNLELSTARALNVLRYLVEEGGLPRENLTAVGYADTRPVASNDTPEGRQENRRIEIILLPKSSAPTPPETGSPAPSS